MLSDEEIVEAVNSACQRLAYKFKFGYHELDDMRQEAYIYAMEAINRNKWDSTRPLKNFIYVHIHNQFFNFKRRFYHRLATPCEKCPLKAYKAATDECMAYDAKEDCKWYAAWIKRNESKKSLMHAVEMSPASHPTISVPTKLEDTDYLDWVGTILPDEFKKTWELSRAGEKVSSTVYKAMIEWLKENAEL